MSSDQPYTLPDSWVYYWNVWKMDGDNLVSFGRDYPTEAEAQAVADGLAHTETRVIRRERVTDAPLPPHLAVTWGEIETGFHEYAADLTKAEMGFEGGATSYPPEFADWTVGMRAARAWLAAHDARVRRDAAREALDGLSTWLGELAEKHPTRTAYVPLAQGNITRYTTDHYPEETP